MSQQNVEVILAMNSVYNAGDLDRWLEFFDPDVEMVPDAALFPESPQSDPISGRDAVRRWVEEFRTALKDEHWELSETRAVGADRVLCRETWSGRGSASGIELARSVWSVWTIRDARVVRAEYYFDHERALQAVGLQE